MLVEDFFEEILCEDARLWETVHARLYFDKDGNIIIGQGCEVAEFGKIRREVAELHAHEFRLVLWCVEVVILQINGAVACVLC